MLTESCKKIVIRGPWQRRIRPGGGGAGFWLLLYLFPRPVVHSLSCGSVVGWCARHCQWGYRYVLGQGRCAWFPGFLSCPRVPFPRGFGDSHAGWRYSLGSLAGHFATPEASSFPLS